MKLRLPALYYSLLTTTLLVGCRDVPNEKSQAAYHLSIEQHIQQAIQSDYAQYHNRTVTDTTLTLQPMRVGNTTIQRQQNVVTIKPRENTVQEETRDHQDHQKQLMAGQLVQQGMIQCKTTNDSLNFVQVKNDYRRIFKTLKESNVEILLGNTSPEKPKDMIVQKHIPFHEQMDMIEKKITTTKTSPLVTRFQK